MPNRGNGRGGRGGRGGNFKANIRSDRSSILSRLGPGSTDYQKNNDRKTQKYKFVRQTTLTSSITSLPKEERIKMQTKRFLKTYFDIFDKQGRENLESQYSSDAFFSFSATIPMPTVGRNLLQVSEPETRVNLLVHDKTNIARALATFSPTEHAINNISIDVPFYVANSMSVISMQLVISGVFKDLAQETNALRAFTRVFVLKLASIDNLGEPKYEIYNDMFMLQQPTPQQIQKHHHDTQIAKRLSNNTSSTKNAQDDQVRRIMAQTKMNKAASTKLLTEHDWDEKKSLEIFEKLYSAGQIPQECFTH